MFALAGSLVARSLDRTTGARVVHNRVRRLLPSLWLLGVVLIPAMLLHGWPTDTGERPLVWYELLYWIFPIADPPGNDWAVDGTGVLWYVRAYLWFVLLSPFLLRLFRRAPVATTLAPLLLVVAYTIGALDLDEWGLTGTGLVDLGTYGTCWLLGFTHHTGAIRRMKLPVLLGPGRRCGDPWGRMGGDAPHSGDRVRSQRDPVGAGSVVRGRGADAAAAVATAGLA